MFDPLTGLPLDQQKRLEMGLPSDRPPAPLAPMASPVDDFPEVAKPGAVLPGEVPPTLERPAPPPVAPPPYLLTRDEDQQPASAVGATAGKGRGGAGGGGTAGGGYAGQMAKLNAAELKAAEEAARFGRQQAVAKKEYADTMTAYQVEERDKQDRINQTAADDFKQKSSAYDAESDKLKQMKPRDFWANKGTGDKVLAVLSVTLGGLGDIFQARSGRTTNYTQTTIGQLENAIERDAQMQTQARSMQRDIVDRSGRDRDASKVDLTAARLNRERVGFELVKAQSEQILAAKGVPPEDISTHPLVVGVQAKALDRKMQLDEFLQKQALTRAQINETNAAAAARRAGAMGGAGTPSDAERKAAGYAERMTNQLQVIKALPPLAEKDREIIRVDASREEFLNKNPKMKQALIETGEYKNVNEKLSPAGRRYYQALREFTAANLRKESGGAITWGEIEDSMQRYMPLAGDSKEDGAAKIRAMEDTASTAYREAGRAAGTISTRPDQSGGGAPRAVKLSAEDLAYLVSESNKGNAQARQMLEDYRATRSGN